MPKGIHPAFIEEFSKTQPFLNGKSSRPFISFGPGDIYLLVTNIQVPAQYCSLLLPQLLEIVLETLVPVVYSVLQTVKFLATVGDVGGYQIELLELHSEDSTLMGVLGLGKVLFD